MTPFTTVKIRVAAAVTNSHDLALIRRVRDGVAQHTLPGGNIEPGEPLHDALRRELDEELRLRLDADARPVLLGVQDQMVSRPGPTPPPRKIHLIFHVPVTDEQRAAFATVEHDDINDGDVLWLPSAKVADLRLFPAVGALLASLNPERPASAVLLPALTDDNFHWI
jgi:8-oxo-dGTP diphosphatase